MASPAETPILRVKSEASGLEIKQQQWAKEKWVWLIDDKEGCIAATIKAENGDKLTLKLPDGNEKTVGRDDVEAMNPPKFDKCEDMATLPQLNESSVLHNLRDRYQSNLIYTYSGLFLVVINPWRRLPLYTDEVVQMYKGKKRRDMPPHIFAVCDEAFRDMLEAREDQSLLITGESGAGKTENTKKVIQYLAHIAGHDVDNKDGGMEMGQLEKQIIKTNPLLESFGNAKTIRNNNSSRFGKFIRIEFSRGGKIVGCYIDNYLLEKSRVVRHNQNERSFHIFYQLLEGATEEMKKAYLLEPMRSYKYLLGVTNIEGVNNANEFKDTIEAMDIIGFTNDNKNDIWQILSGVLLLGNMQFTQGKRDESASFMDVSVAERLSHVMCIPAAEFQKGLLKPRVKAGKEWVTASVNAEKAVDSVDALAKATYERLFKWIVAKINAALETKGDASTFIGCLDIAGFEIFETNSFEQLCINLTNEKLQQFFNHHMFILEQEEYVKEGIEWTFVDFGLDLQPTIDLIEKPMGIMSILDEECLFPQATDKSFIEKMHKTHLGKSEKYRDIRLHPDTFLLVHYAGDVEYNTLGWLEKNKDPINDNIASLFAKSTNTLLASIFEDYKDYQEKLNNPSANRLKGAQFVTVSQRHRKQLDNLMQTLYRTKPHFVRCIIPNEQKKPLLIEAPLVLDQLRCNGVLEGIRIVRMGFPNKVPFAEFRQRYEILAPNAIAKGFMDGKLAAEQLLKALGVESDKYRIGKSKVFFKAGVIADLEERRDARLSSLISGFQAIAKGFLARQSFRRAYGREDAIKCIQKNARVFINMYTWSWWRLYRQVKPLLSVHRQQQNEQAMRDKLKELEDKLNKETELRKELEAKYNALVKEHDEMATELQEEQDALAEAVNAVKRLEEQRREHQKIIGDYEKDIADIEDHNVQLEKEKKALEKQVKDLKEKLTDDSEKLAAIEGVKREMEDQLEELREKHRREKQDLEDELEAEKRKMDGQVAVAKDELHALQSEKEKLKRERNALNDKNKELTEDLESAERQLQNAEKARRELEDDLKKSNDRLKDEESRRKSLEEAKREGDHKIADLKKRLEASETDATVNGQAKENLTAELEDTKNDLDKAERGRAAAERANKDLETRYDEVADKLKEAEDKAKEAEVMVKNLESELTDTKDKLSKAETLADNSLLEALKAEKLERKRLEEALAGETTRRKIAEDRYELEAAKAKEAEGRIREVKNMLRF